MTFKQQEAIQNMSNEELIEWLGRYHYYLMIRTNSMEEIDYNLELYGYFKHEVLKRMGK